MHSQILVIYPEGVDLEDVMYWYQEVDKTQTDKMADDRCRFSLELPEDEIPSALLKIKEYLDESLHEYAEYIEYRSKHTLKEFQEKYGEPFKDWYFGEYIDTIEDLREYMRVKDLSFDDSQQIKFIKKECYWATDKNTEIYIKGQGYGYFDNPYGIWDFYTIIDEHRFPRGTNFLIGKAGDRSNQVPLSWLDVDKTINNIKKYTRVWEHIIFCEKDPSDSKIYTTDTIRFDEDWNEHCVIDNLEDKLKELAQEYSNDDYIVTAIDTHW